MFSPENIVRRRRKDFLILHIIFKITKILNWFGKGLQAGNDEFGVCPHPCGECPENQGKGVQTMLYSAGNIAETKKNADIGDIFYYDGEENLNR